MKKMIATSFLLFTVMVFFVCIALKHPLFFLNDNQISYIFSTCAQILAAIFALTIPSYIFFSNNMDANKTKERPLDDVVNRIKKKSCHRIVLISFLTMCAEICCLLTISGETVETLLYKKLLINVTISFVFIDLFLILHFLHDMIDPKIFDKTLEEIKKASPYYNTSKSSNTEQGSHDDLFTSFKKGYCGIERILRKYESRFLYGNLKKNALNFIVKNLYKNEIISGNLFEELNELICFRNRVCHDENVDISEYAAKKANELEEQLREALLEWEKSKGFLM